jgi:hypothetical protein
MIDKAKSKAIATKIKKWLTTVHELNTQSYPFAISITRLTSLKSLCQDEAAAKHFALSITARIQAQMQESARPEQYSPDEWQTILSLFTQAINLMAAQAETHNDESISAIRKLLKDIDALQGNQYRNIPWGTLHIVRSGELLKLTYSLQCFESNEVPYWAYKLAQEYVEDYMPTCGTGITPRSIPMLLNVAEFWCWHYFQQSLDEKFPEFFPLQK